MEMRYCMMEWDENETVAPVHEETEAGMGS